MRSEEKEAQAGRSLSTSAGFPVQLRELAAAPRVVSILSLRCSGAALGEASLLDFRRLCSVVSTMQDGVWMNLGSAVVLPEVFVKAVSVAHNFGHNLDGLVAVNVDKQSQYRSRVNVLDRPATHGIELIGHHEILLPLLHAAVACRLAVVVPGERAKAA